MTSLDVIKSAWCAETSYWPQDWTPGNPAHGQCAVTALAVQDLLGGDIWRGRVEFVPHYWNRIPGAEIDLTFEQFPEGSQRFVDVPVHRDRLLSDPDTKRRYQLLTSRMTQPTPAIADTTERSPLAREDLNQ